MLEELSEIAREKSGDKRRELMGLIADIFVTNADDYGDQELFLFGEIFTKLLDEVEIDAKIRLSETIAPIDKIPHDLALLLANEEAEVAMPILEQSKVLTDEDLIEIATTKSVEHRISISRRSKLTAPVTDALFARRELPVLQAVCGNKKAEISTEGFSLLADNAEDDAALCGSLSHRKDMPLEILDRVFPLMSPEAQARIVEIAEFHGDAVVESLIEKARNQTSEGSKNRKREVIQSQVLLEEIQEGKRDLAPVVELLCQESRPIDIGYVLSGITSVPEKQIVNALMKKNGKAITVLCRALDLSEKTFTYITDFRTKRLKLSTNVAAREQREFAALDASAAKRTMRFVKVRNVASAA